MIGVRSYGKTLLFQNVFNADKVPGTDPVLKAFARKILNPKIECIEENCGTTIGRRMSALSKLDGLISLETNLAITDDYVKSKLSKGEYYIRVRDGGHCASENGVCSLCASGTNARLGVRLIPSVGTRPELKGTPRAFQNYLADTYSGSLLGYQKVDAEPLPIHGSLWNKVTTNEEVSFMLDRLSKLDIPRDEISYIRSIEDMLEKALMIIAYYGVYSA